MTMQKRRGCLAALGALVAVATSVATTVIPSGSAIAQADAKVDNYPSRPVRIVVGFQAGGPTDVVARLVAKALQGELKTGFVVENRPGATSNIASEIVAAAPADGYTLLMAAAPLTMNKFVYPNQKFDPLTSFAPISKVSSAPGVLAVSPQLEAKSWQDFEKLARARPGGMTYGSTGAGGTQHMATLRLEQLTGLRMVHVPYGGSAGVINDLMAGVTDVAFMTATGAMPTLEAGKVRPIAVAGPTRLASLPDVPTFAELGQPKMVSDSWNALLAPAGTPRPIIDKLAAVVAGAVQTRAFKDALLPQGAILIGSSPDTFRAELEAEVVHWAEQFKNVRIEK